MEKHLLVVFTRPVAGQEEEYHKWYNEQHLPDVTGLPGFVAGQRYVFDEASRNSLSAAPPFGYLALYEVADGELEKAKAAMTAASEERRSAAADGGTRPVRVPGSPAIEPGSVSWWFTMIGERVVSDAGSN